MYEVKCEDCNSLTEFNINPPFFLKDNTQTRGKERRNE